MTLVSKNNTKPTKTKELSYSKKYNIVLKIKQIKNKKNGKSNGNLWLHWTTYCNRQKKSLLNAKGLAVLSLGEFLMETKKFQLKI
jgi:hypothetical protein